MNLMQCKLNPHDALLPCIKIIRAFDASLSIGEIKRRIEQDCEMDMEREL